MKVLSIFFIVYSFAFAPGCSRARAASANCDVWSAGVVFHKDTKLFENTNTFPVVIHQVAFHQGEATKAVKQLEPGSTTTFHFAKSWQQGFFYVRTMNGVAVGGFQQEDLVGD